MDSAKVGTRSGRFTPSASQPPQMPVRGTYSRNSVTASQARAARRREARRDEQAVAAWLRELAGHTR
jgi:hypothetical protein